MQTILGTGGAIGKSLAQYLNEYTDSIRLVSRNPTKVNDSDELVSADLTIQAEVHKAIQGSDIVYVTIGFPYKLKIWSALWPPFMDHVIEACIQYDAKLVFFDNIYMYHPDHLNGMTEETLVDPKSRKGVVRTQVVDKIHKRIESGELKALIARSADFYGPAIKNTSMVTEMVFDPLSKGKKANWLSSVNHKHSFTYTPDAAKATAILGNTEDAYGQVWHLPTADPAMTGREWIETVARELGVKPSIQLATPFIIKAMGLFNPLMRELPEMMYQYDRDYVFVSKKFEDRFQFTPTPYQEGIRQVIESDYRS